MKLAERAQPGTAQVTATVAFWCIAAVPAIVILAMPRLVVQDGGLHMSSAMALRGLIEGWYPTLLDWRPIVTPNITVEAVLAALSTVFSADVSMRIILVIGLFGYAVAVAALMRAAKLPIYTGIPLLVLEMNNFVMMGFVGFVWAVPLALGAVAVAIGRPLDPPKGPLTLLLVAAWFTHLAPAAAATFAVVAITVVAHLANGQDFTKSVVVSVKALAVPVGVVAVLTAAWAVQSQSSVVNHWGSLVASVRSLLRFSTSLVAYSFVENLLVGLLAVAVYAAAGSVIVIRLRERRYLDPMDGLLISALAMALLVVALPEYAKGGAGYIGARFALFGTAFLILWVCTQLSYLRGRAQVTRPVLLALGAVAAVAIPIVRVPALLQLSADADQIQELAPCLPMHSTLVQLNLDNEQSLSTHALVPMAEQTGGLTVARESLDLGNESGWYPFYIWRDTDIARMDNYVRRDGQFDEVPPSVELSAAMHDGVPLTAIVVYGRAAAAQSVLSLPEVADIDRDLDAYFRKVRTSEQGNAELWLRKDIQPTC